MNMDFTDRIKNVEALFQPRSIAVLGANNVKGTVPSDIFENLIKTEFRGVLYPVSPPPPTSWTLRIRWIWPSLCSRVP